MRDTVEQREAANEVAITGAGWVAGRRRALLAVLLLGAAACGGGRGTPSSGPSGAQPTPTPAAPATPSPAPTPAASEPLDVLRLAPAFALLGGAPDDQPPALSHDGRVIAYPQQDAEGFTFEDPRFPGLIRMGYLYCARALVWREVAPPVALDPDPGCPFAETPGQPYGSSWPVALDAAGAVALVNRAGPSDAPRATFGFAGPDGAWDEVVWEIDHPLAARVPSYHGNDMTPDGAIVVGTAWLDRPWPGFADSDARPWRHERGSVGPEWLPAGDDAIESALFVSDDGEVIVGCCDEDEAGRRSLPVVWRGAARPEVLPALDGGDEFGERCRASDLSGDGHVVVGSCGTRAVRWVDGVPSEIVISGEPPPSDVLVSAALAASFDGSLVLGRTNAVGLEQGWLWSEAGGLEPVRALLEAAGIFAGDGSIGGRELLAPSAFTRDGEVLVGRGRSGVGASHFEFVYRATVR